MNRRKFFLATIAAPFVPRIARFPYPVDKSSLSVPITIKFNNLWTWTPSDQLAHEKIKKLIQIIKDTK